MEMACRGERISWETARVGEKEGVGRERGVSGGEKWVV